VCSCSAQQLLQLAQDKAVVVLPAFETQRFTGSRDDPQHLKNYGKVASVAVQLDKRTALSAMKKNGLIEIFDGRYHPTVRAPGSQLLYQGAFQRRASAVDCRLLGTFA
jgi:hypothetical protein